MIQKSSTWLSLIHLVRVIYFKLDMSRQVEIIPSSLQAKLVPSNISNQQLNKIFFDVGRQNKPSSSPTKSSCKVQACFTRNGGFLSVLEELIPIISLWFTQLTLKNELILRSIGIGQSQFTQAKSETGPSQLMQTTKLVVQ